MSLKKNGKSNLVEKNETMFNIVRPLDKGMYFSLKIYFIKLMQFISIYALLIYKIFLPRPISPRK
jgi:hypothetical protein